jgi:hypothetical protein
MVEEGLIPSLLNLYNFLKNLLVRRQQIAEKKFDKCLQVFILVFRHKILVTGMARVIYWTGFPSPPTGFEDLRVVEYKRIFDVDLPPLVIYVGTVLEKGKELPVIVVVEEGEEGAYMYVYESEKAAEEGKKIYAEAYQI